MGNPGLRLTTLPQARTSVTLINSAPEPDRLLFDAQGSSAPTASGDRSLPAVRADCLAPPRQPSRTWMPARLSFRESLFRSEVEQWG